MHARTHTRTHQVARLKDKTVLERERELERHTKEQANLARLAMLPRFDDVTIGHREPNTAVQRAGTDLCDVVENQQNPCEWKPDVDNPHCRFGARGCRMSI